jgi:hypothetical protein
MANNVHAFDAASLGGPPAWVTNLGTPVQGSKAIDNYEINDNWGILSTPVIDDARKRLYCVAWVSPDRSVAKGDHLAFAIDLKNRSQVGEPILLDSATYKPGDGLPTRGSVLVGGGAREARVVDPASIGLQVGIA